MTEHNEWNGSLFGCFDDCETCIYGYYCVACLFGQNAEKIDGSNCCFMSFMYYSLGAVFCHWIPHYFKRTTLRQKYGLPQDPNCPDCPATAFCSPCAICQEARFLKQQEQNNTNAVYTTVSGAMPIANQPRTAH
ncbi:unnamed protein product [Adineta steineri]|uniref:Uncharacterized protein n=1 Tax=Adineta steineri TaxID=433720 RepID=A0A813S9S4_9BILA|nr:unnamed protein product [Adineta steineri]CAF0797257.1 unnamed protein product [Adineta steineri]